MLECDFCACYSPEPGKGWAAYLWDDEIDAPGVRVYCPVCANTWFGLRPEVAAMYLCMWNPPTGDGPNLARDKGAGS